MESWNQKKAAAQRGGLPETAPLTWARDEVISLKCGFVTATELFRGPHPGLSLTGNAWSYPQRLWTCL